MKSLLFIPLLASIGLSTSAMADPYWRDDGYHHRHYRERVEYVVVERPVYVAPRVVYREPPPVVVYRDRPTYYEAPPPRYRNDYRDDYYRDSGSRGNNGVGGQVLGAVAGGVIGSRFGQGNGRVAATAVGAVLGSVVGGQLARDNY